jgi:hypothetical protein
VRHLATTARRPLVVVLATMVLVAVPGTALAQTDEAPETDRPTTDERVTDRADRDRDLESVKARILDAIERRLDALERMSATVDGNEHVGANHAAHLENDYREATRILEEAAEDAEDADTFAELRQIVPTAFQATLVNALLKPKTALVLGSHNAVAVAERMGIFADRLQDIIDRLTEHGFDMTEAQSSLDDMTGLLAAAEAAAEPVAGDVIGLDPDDWPEPAQSMLRAARDDLQGAQEQLRGAHEQAHATVQAIREALSTD